MKHTRALTHLAARIFNTPLLIHPSKAAAILHVLGPRLGLSADAIPMADVGAAPKDDPEPEFAGGVGAIAVISIVGPLVKRSMAIDALSGGPTSYGQIQEQIEDAITDPKVKGIVFDIDSPGGEASGMFELAEFIYSLRGQKPMFAVANDSAYSAAYALASAADKLYLTSFGGVGSIGCYMLHVDQSEMDKEFGLKFTYIHAGDKKVEGNPHEPLSADARAAIQDEVDRIRDGFVSLVARNRSAPAESVLGTQAGCFMGAAAIPLLADKIGTLGDAVNDMAKVIGVTVPAEDDDEEDDAPPGLPTDGPTLAMGGLSGWEFGQAIQKRSLALGLPTDDPALTDLVQHITLKGIRGPAILRSHRVSQSRAGVPVTGRRISLLAVPYGVPSSDLGGFREVYEQGCFSEGLGEDPRVLFNHDSSMVLGRESAKTAHFWEDAEGVHVDCEAPQTPWADGLLVSMRRGDITQASAAFWITKYRWEQRNGERTRVVERAVMRESSVASFPAYESTSATVQPTSELSAEHELELAGARLQLLRSR